MPIVPSVPEEVLGILRDLVAHVNRVDIVTYRGEKELNRKSYKVKGGETLNFKSLTLDEPTHIMAIGYHEDGREIYWDQYPFTGRNIFDYIVPVPSMVHLG